MHNAEPFFFPGGATGCLLIHGFTGTPKEMLWMGEYLSKRGYTVLGIRLAGHATNPEDMRRSRWWDWIASVEDGITILRGATSKVYTIGLSMGGVLSLIAASRYPINGAIAISTPYDMPSDWRLSFIKPLSVLIRNAPKGRPDWQNPEAAVDHAEYPYYPSVSILQLKSLLTEMRSSLAGIKIPVMLVHSKIDKGVDPSNLDRIYASLGTTDKTRLLVEHSGHVIIREPDREQVFKAAVDFIRRVNRVK
ncbi:MAG: alpha/beta fold hydrolase [Anaerolineaceae bacterium]